MFLQALLSESRLGRILEKQTTTSTPIYTVANLVNEQRLLLTTNSKLLARLTESVSLGVAFTVNYDSAPAPMKQSTDTALSVGIEVGL